MDSALSTFSIADSENTNVSEVGSTAGINSELVGEAYHMNGRENIDKCIRC